LWLLYGRVWIGAALAISMQCRGLPLFLIIISSATIVAIDAFLQGFEDAMKVCES
jgi:hypothetical protein